MFFRDPAERLLSAYVDKFQYQARFGASYAVKLFGRRMNFSSFVDVVTQRGPTGFRRRGDMNGLHAWTNPHWRPQRFMCNLEKFLPAYNFVGSFSRLRDHAERLLRATGIWEEYGRSGWLPHTFPHARPHLRSGSKLGNGTAIFEHNTAAHRARHNGKTEAYWTPELLARVKEAYQMDYDMFAAINFTLDGDPAVGTGWARHPENHLLCQSAREFTPC